MVLNRLFITLRCVCAMLVLMTLVSACGAKGDLVLPETEAAPPANTAVTPAINDADKDKPRKSSDTSQ